MRSSCIFASRTETPPLDGTTEQHAYSGERDSTRARARRLGVPGGRKPRRGRISIRGGLSDAASRRASRGPGERASRGHGRPPAQEESVWETDTASFGARTALRACADRDGGRPETRTNQCSRVRRVTGVHRSFAGARNVFLSIVLLFIVIITK